MKIVFSYSLIEELKEAASLVLHKREYTHLRSVVWPSVSRFISFDRNANKEIKRLESIWLRVANHTNQAFHDLSIKDLGNVTCYVHGISCEGWFNVNKNAIHVRTTNVVNNDERELIETIIHELLHLATYRQELTYEQREKIVDEYLNEPQFKKILGRT